MNWMQLLSLKRFGDTKPRVRSEQDELRLGFEVDYDRVLFSHHFRSLQDKTQVIPLSQTGFVHTRLTHSLEVSVVGRSLGRMAGARILEKHPELVAAGYKAQDFGAIVAAAALAHDIGNPPFGHSGEKAIGNYFSDGSGKDFIITLSRKQQQDLIKFEGNANGYRLLNKSLSGTPGGLRLSYATLGAFMKYPKESLPVKPSKHISQKKYGIFQADLDHFQDVAAELGLENPNGVESYHRHPLTFLVEAGDDICYTIIDFEDGINLGWIDEDYALEYLIKIVGPSIKTAIYSELKSTKERLSYLRSLTINTLIDDAVNTFITHEKEILDGSFDKAIMDQSKYKAQLDDIIKLTIEKVYRNPEVIQKEIAGYKILSDILNALVNAAVNNFNENTTSYDQLILNYCDLHFDNCNSTYDIILNTCEFVASLTDSRAIQLFNYINGNIKSTI